MNDPNLAAHWQNVYTTKQDEDLSWHQPSQQLSLDLMKQFAPDASARIIDVGAGNSNLIDQLFDSGYQNVTILDISPAALAISERRLLTKGISANLLVGDILTLPIPTGFDVWHDRALFHFLTKAEDQQRYVDIAVKSIVPGGSLILMTFAMDGPASCSGLDVRRHDTESIDQIFGGSFSRVLSKSVEHFTPWGSSQSFLVVVYERL